MHGMPKHFSHPAADYVNPAAPKGGKPAGACGTFDLAASVHRQERWRSNRKLGYRQLVVARRGSDRVRLIAETIEWPENQLCGLHFAGRRRFHDGTPITVEDVILTFDISGRRVAPQLRLYHHDALKAE